MFRTYLNPFAPAFRFHTVQLPLFDPDDTGGEGGGEGEGTGGGTGEGEGDEQPFTDLSSDENARIKLPGMKKAMTIKEFSATVLPRAQYEGTVKAMNDLAKALTTRQQGGQQQARPGQQGGRQQQQPVTQQQKAQEKDLLAALEGNEIPSGKDLATVLREIDRTRMTPVIQLVVKMAERMQQLEGSVGTGQLERLERDFSGDLTRSIGTLKLPKTAGQEIVGEMARDFFLSFDDADQAKLRGETFDKLFSQRFEATRKFFRNLEKADLERKGLENKRRIFARPGGGSTANGQRRKVFTNRERASALFATEPRT